MCLISRILQCIEFDAMPTEKHSVDDRFSMRTVAAYGRLYEMVAIWMDM